MFERTKHKKSSASDNYESEKLSKLIDICKNAVEVNVSENVESKVVEVSYDYKNWLKKQTLLGRSIVYEKPRARDSSEYRRHKKQKHWRDFTEGQN